MFWLSYESFSILYGFSPKKGSFPVKTVQCCIQEKFGASVSAGGLTGRCFFLQPSPFFPVLYLIFQFLIIKNGTNKKSVGKLVKR